MTIENRPYAGTWKPNFRKTYTWTPDALVYINGDTDIPGCRTCNNRIDLMQFITSISVSAGTDSGGLTANFNYSIPKHHGDSLFIDGTFILVTGLEVHIYFRGFFRQKGLLSELGDDTLVKIEDENGSDTYDLKELEIAPFYPVFHGVISEVSYGYSGGFYSGSVSCRSILSFWDQQFLNNNAAVFASQPTENKGQIQIAGHPFKNNTPYQIIYKLYRDTAGQAHGIATALNETTNMSAKLPSGEDFYSLTVRYWEKRFAEGMYGLRMYGVNGRLFSAVEQNFYATQNAQQITSLITNSLNITGKLKSDDKIGNSAKSLSLIATNPNGRVNRSPAQDLLALPQQSENNAEGVNITQLQYYIEDISAYGSVNLWDSSYESKMEIANSVTEKLGFEFYQDVDGDLVFKPPLYNLDTSTSRVYRIQPEDIISIDFTNSEPEYTYAICKGGPYRNIKSLMDDETLGYRSTYVDYKLVAQYGWKAFDFDTTYYTDMKAAYYAAAYKLDEQNKGMNGCSITIPMRPELKPGYPVYVQHIDCFYYVTGISHSFSFGGECTTNLTLTARRKKFIPPGDPNYNYAENARRAVDLESTYLPMKFLKTRQTPFTIGGADPSQVTITNSDLNAVDNEGNALRTVGFPNVVMALDLKRMDVSFLAMPISEENFSRDIFRHMIILQALKAGIISLQSQRAYNLGDEDGEKGEDFFKGPWVVYKPSTDPNRREEAGVISLDAQDELGGEDAFYKASVERREARKRAIQQNDSLKKREEIAEADKKYDEAIKQLQQSAPDKPLTIVDLLSLLKEYFKSQNALVTPEAGSTASTLSLLSNKKGSFNPNIPGYYRYYSASHPEEEMQGPLELVTDGEKTKMEAAKEALGYYEPFYTVASVQGDEVAFEQKRYEDQFAKRGFRTRTSKTGSNPVLLPTSEIDTLTFQKHSTKIRKKSANLEIGGGLDATADDFANVRKAVANSIRGSLTNYYLGLEAKKKFLAINVVDAGKDPYGIINEIPKGAKHTANFVAEKVSADTAIIDVPTLTAKLKAAMSGANVYSTVISQTKNLKISTTVSFVEQPFTSPIFPVSDGKGYEVFGAYRYGRGLSIAPEANYDAILNSDPVRYYLSQSEIDQLLEDIKNKKSLEDINQAKVDALAKHLTKVGENMQNGGAMDEFSEYLLKSIPTDAQDKTAALKDKLSNFVAKESNTQIVTNIPRRLADIQPSPRARSGEVCECRAVESDVDIEAMSAQYMEIGEDPIMGYYTNKMLEKKSDWLQRQEALRGGTTDGTVNGVFMPKNTIPPIGINSYSDLNPVNSISTATNQLESNLNQALNKATQQYTAEVQALDNASNVSLDYNNQFNDLNDVGIKARSRNIDKLKRDK